MSDWGQVLTATDEIATVGTDMFEEVDLDHMAPNRMKEKNVMRLLSKFLMPLFQHETPAHM